MNGPWNPSGRFERVLVYGLGLSGLAAARLLLKHGDGATVLAVDDKTVDAGDLAGKIEVVRALPPDVDLVVVSPGVPLDRPAKSSFSSLRASTATTETSRDSRSRAAARPDSPRP